MTEPLFWNPLPSAAEWLAQKTGRPMDARTLVDTVAQMGKMQSDAPTIIKAMLPRELKFATLIARGFQKNGVVNEAMNKRLGLPNGMEYVGAAYPTVAPLAVNNLLVLLMYETLNLAVLTGIETASSYEMVWVMPWGTEHTATLETCGINRADLLALGDKLTAPATDTAPPVPVVAVGDGPAPLTKAPAWSLITSLGRAPGYRWPLYQFLKAAHAAGKPCPKARDVLDAWMLKPPPDVQAMPDGVKYNDSLGNQKEANLKAIQQAIKGLLQNEAGQAPPKRRTR